MFKYPLSFSLAKIPVLTICTHILIFIIKTGNKRYSTIKYLKNPKTNRKNAGFTDEERAKFTTLLESGFTDTFRYFYPEQEGIYAWWSYRVKARERNSGWRIDYFLTSDSLKDRLKGAHIYTDIFGSDHCPVELTIEL